VLPATGPPMYRLRPPACCGAPRHRLLSVPRGPISHRFDQQAGWAYQICAATGTAEGPPVTPRASRCCQTQGGPQARDSPTHRHRLLPQPQPVDHAVSQKLYTKFNVRCNAWVADPCALSIKSAPCNSNVIHTYGGFAGPSMPSQCC
jgi:hypothetical protein